MPYSVSPNFSTPYDAQASSACSALINITVYQSLKSNLCSFHMKTFLPSPVWSYQYGPSTSYNVASK